MNYNLKETNIKGEDFRGESIDIVVSSSKSADCFYIEQSGVCITINDWQAKELIDLIKKVME